ncbi:hypothetical protein AGMMS49983_02670 [Clostridia bacterium]|nr:hypothetical protein AGMMS49983_02670 [Clostridia bacterium]
MLCAAAVFVSAPHTYAATAPDTLTINVTKDATGSVQSIAVLPVTFDNAAGYASAVTLSASASDLTHATGTHLAPAALADNSFGFALDGNPAPTPANKIANGFAASYPVTENAKDITLPFAGTHSTGGSAVIQNETPGANSANLYFSAKIAPTLAAGSYHVRVGIEITSYLIAVPPTPPTPPIPTTSLSGTITWDDSNNSDVIRPATADIKLYKTVGVTTSAPVLVTGQTPILDINSIPWAYSFTNLPEFEGGQAINYSVQVGKTPLAYTWSQAGNDITYQHAVGQGILMAEAQFSPKFLNTGIDRYGGPITSVVFSDTLPPVGTMNVDTWDVSDAQDDSVLAKWDGVTRTMTIGAAGGVLANLDSNSLFLDLKLSSGTFDLDNFHAARATNMSIMFFEVTLPASFTSLPDGFGSVATDMNRMFCGTALPAGFTEFPDGFGSVATDMNRMFSGTALTAITELPAGFGSEATDMSQMFNGAALPAGFTKFPDGFGSEATDMNNMFANITLPAGFTEFPDGFGSQATDMNNMFANATLPALTEFPDGFGSVATNMGFMFHTATLPVFTKLPDGFGSVADNMARMFRYSIFPALTEFPDDFGIVATYTDYMFADTTQFTNLTRFGDGSFSQATSLRAMFNNATLPAITEFPADFGSAATDMGSMFDGATLTSNIDWSKTTFANLASSLYVDDMFSYTNFGSYTIKVADAATQTKFTDAATGATPTNIVVATP